MTQNANTTEMTPVHVFVYGTLKQRYSNHVLLRNQSTFVGRASTVRPFSLRDTGGFPVAFKEDAVAHIRGEVYEVSDPRVLSSLDRLEGHPNWYRREPVDVDVDGVGQMKADIYFAVPGAWSRKTSLPECPVHEGYTTWERSAR